MYTPGFAPPEQYKNRELLGPWSDCYAIGASIFACLAGAAPQAADQRVEKDRYVSATKVWNGKYSRQLLETIDWCLQLDHLKRPQSVFALQKVLLREKDPEVHRKSSLMQNLRAGLEEAAGGMRFSIFQESRKGERKANEDRTSYAYTRDALLMVVADGMGGHLHGEVASQIAVQLLTEAFQREARPTLPDPAAFLQKSILDAHFALGDYAKARNLVESPRTTCVACVVQDATALLGARRRLAALPRARGADPGADAGSLARADAGRPGPRARGGRRRPIRTATRSSTASAPPPVPRSSCPSPRRCAEDDTLMLCTDGLWGPLTGKLITASSDEERSHEGDSRAPGSRRAARRRRLRQPLGRRDDLGGNARKGRGGEVSTQTLALDGVSTQLGDFSKADNSDLTDEEIERAIQEIRAAIRKHTPQKP